MKIRMDIRQCAVVWNRLFKRGANELFRRCVSEVEVPSILEAYSR